MQPKEYTPVSGPKSLIWAELSFTWTTWRGLVATGSTRDASTPARAMEARRPETVPST